MTIAIVGAGPVGLTLACLLRQQGIDVDVYEREIRKAKISKAFALHARTLELFRQIGISDAVVAQGRAIRRMNLYSGQQRLGTLDFRHLDNAFPYFVSLPQYQLEEILRGRLQELGGQVHWGEQLNLLAQDDDGVTLSLGSGLRSRHEYAIGCDGAHSRVRKLLQVGFGGDTYDSEFLVVDARLHWSGNNYEAHTFLSRRGYLMVMPFAGRRHRVVTDVQTGQFERPPTLDQVHDLLAHKGFTDVRLSEPDWISTTRYHRRLADRFRHGRIFLAGDACHIHSPIGGQGLNTGLQDAFNLGWKLAMVYRGWASADLLDSYETERRQVAEQVLASTDAMTRRFASNNPIKTGLSRLLMPLLFPSPRLQKKLSLNASGLAVHYRDCGPAWRRDAGRPALAGCRLPDLPLLDSAGDKLRLHQQLSASGYCLLHFTDGQPDTELQSALGSCVSSYPAVAASMEIAFDQERAPSPQGPTARYFAQRPRDWRGSAGLVALVRPDGYVDASYKETELPLLQSDLSARLLPGIPQAQTGKRAAHFPHPPENESAKEIDDEVVL
ncbi:FAD-dependent monooxygenase [Microbulbifer litoralis]|uniref:FAD-dependent monooxygenase n=1 Tax=Microbulbifer litoralis TaxID=2933965 RepID=UPI0020287950|nr:FAD-dependent monooxygenase [Microbulbifer sp. GX H0434]